MRERERERLCHGMCVMAAAITKLESSASAMPHLDVLIDGSTLK